MSSVVPVYNSLLTSTKRAQARQELEFRVNKILVTQDRVERFQNTWQGATPTTSKSTVTYLPDNVRQIDTGERSSWEVKKQLMDYKIRSDYLIVISSEKSVPEPKSPQYSRPPQVKERSRLTFVHPTLPIVVEVTNTNRGIEFEVEYAHHDQPVTTEIVDAMKAIVEDFIKPVPGIIIPPTPQRHENGQGAMVYLASSRNVEDRYNGMFLSHSARSYTRLKFPISKPRDLQLTDLQWQTMSQYMATYKANGERMVLYLESPTSMYSVQRSQFTRLNSPSTGNLSPSRYPILVDGEWFEDTSTFYAFDLVVADSRYLTRDVDRSRRIAELSKLVPDLPTLLLPGLANEIRVEIKPYFTWGNSVEEYRKAIQDLIGLSATLPYETDGIIFEHMYDKVGLKWKRPEDQTLDFQLLPGNRLGYINEQNRIIPLYPEYPFENTIGARTGDIVEFRWDNDTFRSVRIRNDRSTPNFKSQVFAGLDLIKNPIPLSTVEAMGDLTLTRRYHNRVKQSVYELLDEKLAPGYTLLDIGSGTGGDVSKWDHSKKLGSVKAIEVNPDNFERLTERIAQSRGSPQQYHPVLTSFMDYEPQRPNEKYDVVTSFNSLTFFADEQQLPRFMRQVDRYLKLGGYLVLLYMDGSLTKTNMPPPHYQGTSIDLKYSDVVKDEVTITIKASGIVTNQTEHLIDRNRLWDQLLPSYYLLESRVLDQEPLQSEDGLRLSLSTKLLILQKIGPFYESDRYDIIGSNKQQEYPAVLIQGDSRDLIAVTLSSIYAPYYNERRPSRRLQIVNQVADALEANSGDNPLSLIEDGGPPPPIDEAEALSRTLGINFTFLDADALAGKDGKLVQGSRPNINTATTGRNLILAQRGDDYWLVGKLEGNGGTVTTNFHNSEAIYINGQLVEW